MKYIVMLGDGMADLPLAELGNKTPLQIAEKPSMDFIAKNGALGLVKTVSGGLPPGSDVANLSVMGYDPMKYYTGRSPIEAVSMGIELASTDVAVRCNLVTLSEEIDYAEKKMIDYSSDEITTEESRALIEGVEELLGDEVVEFYAGISYRHCMVWKNGLTGLNLTPPHDISGKKIGDYLPKNELIRELMVKSNAFLVNHPVNKARVERGLNPATSVWLWGEGTKLSIPSFKEKYGLTGTAVSAVDLVKGLAISAGLDVVDVPGVTGNIHTNYVGKKDAAVDALKSGKNFVYIHVEAPDECGHRHEIENKVKAIELIDEKILTPLLEELKQFGEFRILLLPDHPTPLALMTHTSDPVPFALYDSSSEKGSGKGYDEKQAEKTGVFVAEGHNLMDMFINGTLCRED